MNGTLRLGASHLPLLAGMVTEAAVLAGSASPFEEDGDARAALLRSSATPTGRA